MTRGEAATIIKRIRYYMEGGEGWTDAEFTAMDMTIEALRSEQRVGKWIPAFDGKFTGGAYWFKCSECQHIVAGGYQSGNFFCENCGAKMSGGEQE